MRRSEWWANRNAENLVGLGNAPYRYVRASRRQRVPLTIELYAITAQVEWARETLEAAGTLATKAGIDLEIKVFVTRSDAGTLSASPSLDERSDEYVDEKNASGEPFDLAGRSFRFHGRPDIHAEVAAAVSESGRTLVVGALCLRLHALCCICRADGSLYMQLVDHPNWLGMSQKLLRLTPAQGLRSRSQSSNARVMMPRERWGGRVFVCTAHSDLSVDVIIFRP